MFRGGMASALRFAAAAAVRHAVCSRSPAMRHHLDSGLALKVQRKYGVGYPHRGPDGKVNEVSQNQIYQSSARVVPSLASEAWIEDRIKTILRTTPTLLPIELQKKLEADYNVKLEYNTVCKVKERTNRALYGTWEDSFQILFNFKAEIEKRCPGSVVEIDVQMVDGKIRFSRFFMALKPCIDGFLAGCRPYLSIDGTILSGKWNGKLASCTSLDGHNGMFPIAIGFIESENEDNWTWFMTQLHRALGPIPTLAICTDACKGLQNAVKNTFPYAEQRECFWHIMQHVKKRYQHAIFDLMYPAAKAYRFKVFKRHMAKIFAACKPAETYLKSRHNLLWYKCGFNPEIKCDSINNNIAECFNSWISDIRDLHVDQIADAVTKKIIKLFRKRRIIGEQLQGRMLPAIIQKLYTRSTDLGHLKISTSAARGCKIKCSKTNFTYVVKIDTHECTCLEWQHTGKPCDHALVLLMGTRNNMEEFVHDYYSLERFRAAYAGEIEPIADRSHWPKVILDFELNPPIAKRRVGRPRLARITSCLENRGNGRKLKVLTGSQYKCGICRESGHRRQTCPLNGPRKMKRRINKRKRAKKRRIYVDDEAAATLEVAARWPRPEAPAVLEGTCTSPCFA